MFQKITEKMEYFNNRLQAIEQALNFKDREQSIHLKMHVDALQKQINELWESIEQ